MPSVSGCALQPWFLIEGKNLFAYRFLCPQSRAGLCNHQHQYRTGRAHTVSMPSVSGWAL